MKIHRYMAGLLMACSLTSPAIAQSNLAATTNEPFVPRLGDIMNGVQARHMKLWFAGKAQNWELATYELRQLKAGVLEAALLYEGIPVTNVTTMSKPLQSLSEAIEAKDPKRFARAVGELTDGCNSCHRAMERSFIAIQAPTVSPFSNQVFTPQKKQ